MKCRRAYADAPERYIFVDACSERDYNEDGLELDFCIDGTELDQTSGISQVWLFPVQVWAADYHSFYQGLELRPGMIQNFQNSLRIWS